MSDGRIDASKEGSDGASVVICGRAFVGVNVGVRVDALDGRSVGVRDGCRVGLEVGADDAFATCTTSTSPRMTEYKSRPFR